MSVRIEHALPIGGAGCGDVSIGFDDDKLTLRWRDGKATGSIEFAGVDAFRFRDEMRSRGFPPEAYDALVEVQESPWKQELIALEPPSIRSTANRRHFAIFVSNNGFLEVIATGYSVRRG